MEYWITLLLAIGATMRITRLVTLDTITEPARERLRGWAETLFTCGWCFSFWAAIPVIISWHYLHTHTLWVIAAAILTCSWITGALSNASLPVRVEAITLAPIVTIDGDGLADEIEEYEDNADNAPAPGDA